MRRRALSLLLALVMVLGLGVSALGAPEDMPVPTDGQEPIQTPAQPDDTAPESAETAAPTAEPADVPAETAEPTAEPEQTAEPAPEETEEPVQTPEPSGEPGETAEPTPEPDQTPDPDAELMTVAEEGATFTINREEVTMWGKRPVILDVYMEPYNSAYRNWTCTSSDESVLTLQKWAQHDIITMGPPQS